MRLIELGLFEEETDGAVRLHRLLAMFVRAATSDEEVQGAVEDVILKVARHVNVTDHLFQQIALHPHLVAITDAAQQREDIQAAALCNALGYHLSRFGNYTAARRYTARALRILEQRLGSGHPDTCIVRGNLVSLDTPPQSAEE